MKILLVFLGVKISSFQPHQNHEAAVAPVCMESDERMFEAARTTFEGLIACSWSAWSFATAAAVADQVHNARLFRGDSRQQAAVRHPRLAAPQQDLLCIVTCVSTHISLGPSQLRCPLETDLASRT